MITFIFRGPLQITASESFSRKKAMLMTFMPYDAVTGVTLLARAGFVRFPSRPSILAMFGPWMSVSRSPTRCPL